MMKRFSLTALSLLLLPIACAAQSVITVKPPKGDATAAIAKAIDKAARSGKPTTICLLPGTFRLHADKASMRPYRVSNTASEEEHNTANKHVGILLRKLSGITIDGGGEATLLTHGEMTPWVIDSCTNVTIKGLTIDAADPSVPEMTVIARTDSTITTSVHPSSRYTIRNSRLYWQGYGWEFTDGIAQIHRPAQGTSTRCASPVADASEVRELKPGILLFCYPPGKAPDDAPGDTYQMRHSIRNEVAGLINGSSNTTLRDLNIAFLGNFGIVAQCSDGITYRNINFAPTPGSGRTDAGFADFLQVSGCRGLITVDSCVFAGSHDDPINIHGTHLSVTDASHSKLTLRYRHPQTFGFQSFFAGDSILVTDPETLLPMTRAKVSAAVMTSPYIIEVSLTEPLAMAPEKIKNMIVENLTWCPEVKITNCHFTLTPTRGILVSTRRPVSITDCTFLRCPMAAILIADDGRSWYESGPVTDVTIAHNKFIDCSSPVILIAPEARMVPDQFVHSGISITDNSFISDKPVDINARSVDGLTIRRNSVTNSQGAPAELRLNLTNVR